MTRSSFLAAVAATALLATALAPVAARSAERQAFETAKGWKVERTLDGASDSCVMSHVYEDEDDDGAKNAIVFSLEDGKANLVLVYQNWDWGKDEKVKVPLYFDKKSIDAKSKWVGDGKLVSAAFPKTIVPGLMAAKTIVLRFDDGNADFEIPDFAAGYEALIRCNAAPAATAAAPQPAPAPVAPAVAPAPVAPPAAPAPVAPAPSAPSANAATTPGKAQILSYVIGISLRRTIERCDLPTTGKQRATVDAKVAALESELGAGVAGQLRGELDSKPAVCPPSAADFKRLLDAFVEKNADAFAAFAESFETTAPDKPAN